MRSLALLAFIPLLFGCETIRVNTDGNSPIVSTMPEAQAEVFSSEEIALLKNRYANKSHKKKKLPPGLQKKAARGKSLPPGWQMKLERGEVLSPDIYKHGKSVDVKLPRENDGTQTIIIEGKAVRIIRATHEIIDALELGK